MFAWIRSLFTKESTSVMLVDSADSVEMSIQQNVVHFDTPVSPDEQELVSVIASSIAAGDKPDSSFTVKKVTGIDVEKEIAAAIVAAVMANDQPDSTFRLVSIKEFEK